MYGTLYSMLYFSVNEVCGVLLLLLRGAIFLIEFWSSTSGNQTERIKVRSNELSYSLLLKIVVALVSHTIIAEWMSRVPIYELSYFELGIRPIAGGNFKTRGWEFIGGGLLLISGLNN